MTITTTPDYDLYTVTTKPSTVQLAPIQGEPGRFHAFSTTRYFCPQCRIKFTRKAGKECKRCGGEGEAVSYIADVTENGGAGKCSCESHSCNRRDIQEPGTLEICKHIAAAMALHGYFLATLAAQEESAERMQSISKAGNCADW